MIPPILKQPLIFGNKAQYETLKALEAEDELCEQCDGEGTITCVKCDGTGKR
jgi:DnaJ-class molecular chaperone